MSTKEMVTECSYHRFMFPGTLLPNFWIRCWNTGAVFSHPKGQDILMRAWLAVSVSDKIYVCGTPKDLEKYYFINRSCLSVDGMNHQEQMKSVAVC